MMLVGVESSRPSDIFPQIVNTGDRSSAQLSLPSSFLIHRWPDGDLRTLNTTWAQKFDRSLGIHQQSVGFCPLFSTATRSKTRTGEASSHVSSSSDAERKLFPGVPAYPLEGSTSVIRAPCAMGSLLYLIKCHRKGIERFCS